MVADRHVGGFLEPDACGEMWVGTLGSAREELFILIRS